jgi:hypothetical protein
MKTYREYELRLNVLKKTIEKLENIFNVASYKHEIELIEQEVREIDNSKIEQENIDYTPYTDKLFRLTQSVNKEYISYYELYLLTLQIESLNNKIDENNYEEEIDIIKKAIDCLNNVLLNSNNSKKEDCKQVVDNAIKAVYQSLVQERAIEREEIFNYIKKIKNYILEDNLGLFLKEDINKLPKETKAMIELNHLNKGLEYSYLTKDSLDYITSEVASEKKDSYIQRRHSAAMEVLESLDEIKDDKKDLEDDRSEQRKTITNLRVNLNVLRLKLAAWILIPTTIVLAGFPLGGTHIKNAEYTTKTYNIESTDDKKIESGRELCWHTEPKYDIEIKKCSPWVKNGNSYVRDYTQYSYKTNEAEEFDVEKIMREASSDTGSEEKDSLEDWENTTDPVIEVTEKFLDMDNASPSVLGMSLGVLAALLLVVSVLAALEDHGIIFETEVNETWDEIKRKERELKRVLETKMTRKVIKERTALIGEKKVKLQEEFNTAFGKFGDLVDEIKPEQLEEVKKYVRRGR